MSYKRNFFFFLSHDRIPNDHKTLLLRFYFKFIRNSSRYENDSSQSYRYINIINSFRFDAFLWLIIAVPFRTRWSFVFEENDSYRSTRFIRAKVEWRGEIEEEKRVVVEKDETVRNVARSTLPFPRLNIAIQLFDPVLRLPSGGNLLLPPPPSSGIAL